MCCSLGLEWASFSYPHSLPPHLRVFVQMLTSQTILDVSFLIWLFSIYHSNICLFISVYLPPRMSAAPGQGFGGHFYSLLYP